MAKATDKAPAELEGHVIRVWLGNRATIELVDDLEAAAKMSADELAATGVPKIRRPVPIRKNSTYFGLPEGTKLFDGINDIVKAWPNMSDDPAPAWVASTDQRYAELLAEHWGGIEVRQPENPDVMHGPYNVDEGA